MAFFSLSCLTPEYIVQHLQTGHTQHWRVHRQEGPTVENLHLLGTITKHPGSYVAQQSLPTKTQAFLTLEEAALWIRQTAPASVALLGLEAFGQRALSMLWRHDRGYYMTDASDMPSHLGLDKAFQPRLAFGMVPPLPLALVGQVLEGNTVIETPMLGLAICYLHNVHFPNVTYTKAGWSTAYGYGTILRKRATRKSLKDLLLMIARDTYAIMPNTTAHTRLKDQQDALDSLEGIEDRVQHYFDHFPRYAQQVKPQQRSPDALS